MGKIIKVRTSETIGQFQKSNIHVTGILGREKRTEHKEVLKYLNRI
jgi:hypothetical protein